MSYYTDGGTELPDKDDIAKLIRTLSLGYEFQMSDYATSHEQEREYERKGLAEVDRVARQIAEMIEEAHRQGTYVGEGGDW